MNFLTTILCSILWLSLSLPRWHKLGKFPWINCLNYFLCIISFLMTLLSTVKGKAWNTQQQKGPKLCVPYSIWNNLYYKHILDLVVVDLVWHFTTPSCYFYEKYDRYPYSVSNFRTKVISIDCLETKSGKTTSTVKLLMLALGYFALGSTWVAVLLRKIFCKAQAPKVLLPDKKFSLNGIHKVGNSAIAVNQGVDHIAVKVGLLYSFSTQCAPRVIVAGRINKL